VNYSGANSRSWRVPETPFLGAPDTVRCTPDNPVNYSEAPLDFPEGEEFSVKSLGAPDSPVRQTREHFGYPFALFVEPKSWSFYWLSVNLWHLYNLYTRAKLVSPIICVGKFNHQNQLGTRCKPNSLSTPSSPVLPSFSWWLAPKCFSHKSILAYDNATIPERGGSTMTTVQVKGRGWRCRGEAGGDRLAEGGEGWRMRDDRNNIVHWIWVSKEDRVVELSVLLVLMVC
jgi:hypothetical protein